MYQELKTPSDVAEYLEERGWFGTVRNVVDVGNGSMSRVWRVKTEEGTFALKQATEHDNAVGDVMPIDRIRYEASYAYHYQSSPISRQVEGIILHDGEMSVNVFEWCDGRTLRDMLDADDPIPEYVGRRIGKFLIGEHDTLMDSDGIDAIGQNPMDEVTIQHMLIDPFQNVSRNNVNDGNRLLATMVYADDDLVGASKRLVDAFKRRECLIHGDFTPNNLFIDDVGNITTFDFDFATPGNVAYDVGTMLGHLLLAIILKTYGKADRNVIISISRTFLAVVAMIDNTCMTDDDIRTAFGFAGSTMLAHTYGHVPFWDILTLPAECREPCCRTIYDIVRTLIIGRESPLS